MNRGGLSRFRTISITSDNDAVNDYCLQLGIEKLGLYIRKCIRQKLDLRKYEFSTSDYSHATHLG